MFVSSILLLVSVSCLLSSSITASIRLFTSSIRLFVSASSFLTARSSSTMVPRYSRNMSSVVSFLPCASFCTTTLTASPSAAETAGSMWKARRRLIKLTCDGDPIAWPALGGRGGDHAAFQPPLRGAYPRRSAVPPARQSPQTTCLYMSRRQAACKALPGSQVRLEVWLAVGCPPNEVCRPHVAVGPYSTMAPATTSMPSLLARSWASLATLTPTMMCFRACLPSILSTIPHFWWNHSTSSSSTRDLTSRR